MFRHLRWHSAVAARCDTQRGRTRARSLDLSRPGQIPNPKSRIPARIEGMPPRYAYWTILIDQKPTAFRAREREELLPTFHQLRRKNTDVVMKWFARGRLWESPEAAQAAQRAPTSPLEKRGRDWRPGGEHRDPRERFKKRSQPHGARPEPRRDRQKPGARRESRPWTDKPGSEPLGGGLPSGGRPKGGPPRGDRRWSGKPPATAQRQDRPTGEPPWRGENRKPFSPHGRKS